MIERYLRHLHAQCEEQRKKISRQTASGLDEERYREACGRYKGLHDAQVLINQMLDKLKANEEILEDDDEGVLTDGDG